MWKRRDLARWSCEFGSCWTNLCSCGLVLIVLITENKDITAIRSHQVHGFWRKPSFEQAHYSMAIGTLIEATDNKEL